MQVYEGVYGMVAGRDGTVVTHAAGSDCTHWITVYNSQLIMTFHPEKA